MGPRSTLKHLKKFSKQELKDKNAERVYVQRAKMESFLRKGKLPNLRAKEVKGTHFLVCVFHDKSLRVYFMDKNGNMTGAEDFTGEEKESTWQSISKETKNVFRFSN